MKLTLYCSDGIIRNDDIDPPKQPAFYKDSNGFWHTTVLGTEVDLESLCIKVHEAIRMAVYSRQEFEDSRLIVESPFIYDAGIDAELKISKDSFEKIVEANDASKNELHQALYWQDYTFLLSNVQSGISEILAATGAFYQAFCEYKFVGIPESERNGVRRTDSPETRFATLMLHIVFVRMHSVLDYLVKLSLEVDRSVVDFAKYPKLIGKNAQFGDRKKISINKVAGTVFEDCVFIRTIETIRNRIIHDGHLSPNQWIYENWDGGKITEKFILIPDMRVNPGAFDSSGNRKSFYGEDNKINELLPGMLNEFYARTEVTLSRLHDHLTAKSRW
jgi:hypothetical protein